jgi:hypothetical protein
LIGFLLASAARAAMPHPYVAPWLSIEPGDPRIARIAALPLASHSPNAPGLLLKVGAPGWTAGRAASVAAERELAERAYAAGWKWGLRLDLPDAAVPTDVRAAEAATVDDLWPGLGDPRRSHDGRPRGDRPPAACSRQRQGARIFS